MSVTVVVVPRERFSATQESLESIYKHTQFPFQLVYVDGNSPSKIQRYLKAQAQAKHFQLVRTNYYLTPNQARNLGLRQVKTKYVVFIDNDVIVSPGWLTALVNCTEETGATVVGSLVCQTTPTDGTIHCAGGDYMPPEEFNQFVAEPASLSTKGKWQLQDKENIYRQGQKLANVCDQLKREPTEFVEVHSLLVRTEIFKQIGGFDEKILSAKDYLDFCIAVRKAGGTVYFEPASVVTFLGHPPGPALAWSDIPYFMLRWSDAWELASLHRLRDKWNFHENTFFTRRYKRLGWRRAIKIRELSRSLSFGFENKLLIKVLRATDRAYNRYLTDQYAQKQVQHQQKTSIQSPELQH